MVRRIEEAVGVCRQCSEAACWKHGVKSELYLPSAYGRLPPGNKVLMFFLCEDCHRESAKAMDHSTA